MGPKWHLDIENFTKISQKNVFQIFSDFFGHIIKSSVFLVSSIALVKWLRDIFLSREICSQSRGISFSKINKIANC